MPKNNLKAKNDIKNAFSIIVMYISFIKSFANGTFGTDIVILDQLEAEQIKILPLSMHFCYARDRFCSIYKQAGFYIQNQFHYEYGCIIPFTGQVLAGFEPAHTPLMINNDISTHFVDQKFSYSLLLHCFFLYKFTLLQRNKRNLYIFVQE